MQFVSTLFRALFGFLLACVMFGLVQVLFVITPAELSALSSEQVSAKLPEVGVLALLAATHAGIFASAFALILTAIGEWFAVRSAAYYVAAALAIALLGFYAQYASEVSGQPTVMNNYALAAFLTAGVAAGWTYWLAAGRRAGLRAERQAAATALSQPPLIVETPPPLENEVVTITKIRTEPPKSPPRRDNDKADRNEVKSSAADDNDGTDDNATRFERPKASKSSD